MVWTRVKIDQGKISERLSRLLLNDAKRTQMLDQIGEASVREIKMHFINQKSPEGVRWKVSKRAENDPSRPTMLHRLVLFNSITHKVSGGQVSAGTDEIKAGTLNFGAKKGQYGAVKDTGQPIPFGDIPARKFIGVSSQNVVRVRDIVNSFLRRQSQ
ncbi:MAG: phage virion morphogenesis protein [Pseudomonadota bacterium]|nr:phage virion morphogenesis protein [Pseudomonadota bacterium]